MATSTNQPEPTKKAEEIQRELEKLQHQYRQFNQLLKYSPDILWTLDLNYIFTYISPSIHLPEYYKEIPDFGLQHILPEEAFAKVKRIGSETLELIQQKKRPLTEPIKIELPLKRPDGSQSWAEVVTTFITDSNENIIGLSGITRDISVRKITEKALLESKEQFRKLFSNSPVSLWLFDFSNLHPYLKSIENKVHNDIEGYLESSTEEVWNCIAQVKIIDVNKATLQLFNAPNKIELENNFRKIFTPNAFDVFKMQIINFLFNQRETGIETRFNTVDGHSIWVFLKTNSINELANNDARVLISMENITQQKLTERSLKRSEKKFKSIFDSISDGIIIFTFEGDILDLNKAAENIFKRTKSEFLNISFWDTLPLFDKASIINRMKTDNQFIFESIIENTGSESIPIELNMNVSNYLDSDVIVAVVRNIRTRKLEELKNKALTRLSGMNTDKINRIIQFALEESVKISDSTHGFIYMGNNIGNLRLTHYVANGKFFIRRRKEKLDFDPFDIAFEVITLNKLYIKNENHSDTKFPYPEKLICVPVTNEKFFVAALIFVGKSKNYENADIQNLQLLFDRVWKNMQIDYAENARKQSEEKYRVLVENHPEMVIELDLNNKYSFVNKNYCEVFGESNENLIGKNFQHNVHTADQELVVAAMRQLYSIPFQTYMEYRVKTPDGWKWQAWSHKAVLDSTGQVVSTVGIGYDITNRKNAEIALAESEEKLSRIFEASPDPIMLLNREGIIKDCNETSATFLGAAQKEDILNRNFTEFLIHENKITDYKKTLKNQKTDVHRNLRFQLKTIDNQVFFVDISLGIIQQQDNGSSIVMLLKDVTEREKMISQLIESREKLQRVLEASPDSIVVFDFQGVIVECNEATEKLLEAKSKNEIIGNNVFNFFDQVRAGILRKELQKIRNQQEIINARFSIKTLNNNNIPVSASLNIIVDNKQVPTFFVSVLKDVTEQIEYEYKLKKSAKHAEELNASKDKFFSIISHDLKNPFNSMIGISDLLLECLNDYSYDEIKSFVQLINTSAQRGYELLENLLEWSRTQTGSIKFMPEYANLKEIIDINIELLLTKAQNKKINIAVEVDENHSAFIDIHMISTVIRNLLSNALKFTTRGGEIKITTQNIENKIRIDVADNGVGISPEKIAALFKIDKEVSTVGPDNEKGTGLGLILVKEFVNINTGEIMVESTEGVGTTFSIILPTEMPD